MQKTTTRDFIFEIGNIKISCKITEEWVSIYTTSILCGIVEKRIIEKSIGFSKKEVQNFKSLLKGSFGLGNLASIESQFDFANKREFSFDKHNLESREVIFEAPKCGRRTYEIFQLVKTFDIILESKSFFSTLKKNRNIKLHEEVNKFHYEVDDVPYISSCSCSDKEKPNDARGIMIVNLYHPSFTFKTNAIVYPNSILINALYVKIKFPNINFSDKYLGKNIKSNKIELDINTVPSWLNFLSLNHEKDIILTVSSFDKFKYDYHLKDVSGLAVDGTITDFRTYIEEKAGSTESMLTSYKMKKNTYKKQEGKVIKKKKKDYLPPSLLNKEKPK